MALSRIARIDMAGEPSGLEQWVACHPQGVLACCDEQGLLRYGEARYAPTSGESLDFGGGPSLAPFGQARVFRSKDGALFAASLAGSEKIAVPIEGYPIRENARCLQVPAIGPAVRGHDPLTLYLKLPPRLVPEKVTSIRLQEAFPGLQLFFNAGPLSPGAVLQLPTLYKSWPLLSLHFRGSSFLHMDFLVTHSS